MARLSQIPYSISLPAECGSKRYPEQAKRYPERENGYPERENGYPERANR